MYPAERVRTKVSAQRLFGVEAIDQLRKVYDVPHASHVFLAQMLSNMLTEACGDIVWAEGGFWAWGPTCWTPLPALALRSAMHKFDGATKGGGTRNLEVNVSLIDGVLTELKTLTAQLDFFAEPVVGLNARKP